MSVLVCSGYGFDNVGEQFVRQAGNGLDKVIFVVRERWIADSIVSPGIDVRRSNSGSSSRKNAVMRQRNFTWPGVPCRS